jgi:antitoxin HicB
VCLERRDPRKQRLVAGGSRREDPPGERWYREKDDNETFLVTFPDFPEAHTFGDTKDEALARAVDALATIIDAYIRDRQAIPRPSRVTRHAVSLPALMTSKVALYEIMRSERIGKAELARRLSWHLPQVDRLLDVHHASRLDQMEVAFEALGRRMLVVVRKADKERHGRRRRAA